MLVILTFIGGYEMTRWVQPTNVKFESMKTVVGFKVVEGVVAVSPVWGWMTIALVTGFVLGIVIF